ncbi:hypothetical protein AB6A40_008330 [Gnathostoma spinigerum]|uniref:Uncharacterized protein n=1 Tax=Gnathostoma spinigerum TaxID=75299 RepID=A0ABD6EP64_9BILA
MKHLLFTTVALFFSQLHMVVAIVCYDCFAVSQGNDDCSKSSNCEGEACLLYEGSQRLSMSALCVTSIPPNLDRKSENQTICWLDTDGLGKHCMCSTPFCNKPQNQRRYVANGNFDGATPTVPLPNATFIDHNPLIADQNYLQSKINDAIFQFVSLDEVVSKANEMDTAKGGSELSPMNSEDYEDYEEYKDEFDGDYLSIDRQNKELSKTNSEGPILRLPNQNGDILSEEFPETDEILPTKATPKSLDFLEGSSENWQQQPSAPPLANPISHNEGLLPALSTETSNRRIFVRPVPEKSNEHSGNRIEEHSTSEEAASKNPEKQKNRTNPQSEGDPDAITSGDGSSRYFLTLLLILSLMIFF